MLFKEKKRQLQQSWRWFPICHSGVFVLSPAVRLLRMGKVERMSFKRFSRSQNFKRVIFKRPAFNIFVLRKTNSCLTERVIFETSFWQLDRFWNKSRQPLSRSNLFDPDDCPASCRHSSVGSTAVEHLPSDPVVKGSNPAWHWRLLLSFSFLPK